MKTFLTIALLGLATSTFADSLCGITDETIILQHLQGDWFFEGSISVETETFSATREANGTAVFRENRAVIIAPEGMGVALSVSAGELVYDVDQVDDMLETVEAEWIADAVSQTPCGPENLLQMSGGSHDADQSSQLVILPYFDDQMIAVYESETRGEWGLGFVTLAGLLTRQ